MRRFEVFFIPLPRREGVHVSRNVNKTPHPRPLPPEAGERGGGRAAPLCPCPGAGGRGIIHVGGGRLAGTFSPSARGTRWERRTHDRHSAGTERPRDAPPAAGPRRRQGV